MSALIPFLRNSSVNDWIFDMDRFLDPIVKEPGFMSLVGDLRETPENFILSYDVPGPKTEDFSVTVEDHTLIISGERKSEFENKEGQVAVKSRRYGKFHKALSLPQEINSALIDAKYEDGVLTVTIPKAEKKKANVIEVKVKS